MAKSRSLWAYIRNYRFNSLLIRNFMLTLPLLLFPLIGIEVTTYMTSYSVTKENVSDTSYHSLLRLGDIMEKIFTDIDRIAVKLSLDDNVRLFMLSSSFGELYNANLEKEVLDSINMYMDVNSYIDSVYIFSEASQNVIYRQNGSLVGIGDEEKEWYGEYRRNIDLAPAVVPRYRNNNFPFVITIVRPISLNRSEWIGSILINIDTSRLHAQIGQINGQTTENIFIVNQDKTIVYNNDISMTAKSLSSVPLLSRIELNGEQFSINQSFEGQESIITGILSKNAERWYLSVIPMEAFTKKFAVLKKLYFVLILFGVGASMLISLYISYRTFRPISTIISIIENQGDAGQDRRFKLKANEVKFIVDSIVKIIYSNKEFRKELEQRVTFLNKAQAVALQSQINPHFLFNTLENINLNAIKLGGEENSVSSMITNLSEMLRIVIDAKTHFIPIKKEVEHVKYFIEIMNARYQNKWSFVWNMPNELDNYKIMKICIQPLVENAIQHGLSGRRRKGTITISGWLEEERIVIKVTDDGVGMLPDKIEQLNERFANGDIFENIHIGLSNVNQRLKLIYGHPYGLRITSGENIGTSVYLNIPRNPSEPAEESYDPPES